MKSLLVLSAMLTAILVSSTVEAQCFVNRGFVQQRFIAQPQFVSNNGLVCNQFGQCQQQFVQQRFVNQRFVQQPQFVQPQFINTGFNRGFVQQPQFINTGFNRGFVQQPVFINNRGFVRQPVFIGRRRFIGSGIGFGFGGVRSLSLLGVFGRDAQRFSAFRAGFFGF